MIKIGIWKYYYPNGKLAKEENQESGPYSWYENGNIKEQYNHLNGKNKVYILAITLILK